MTVLPTFVEDRLNNCPPAGNGVNRWIFDTSRHLHAHLSPEHILELMREKTRQCGRPVLDREIIRQVECSRPVAWTPNHPERFAYAGDLDLEIRLAARPPMPTWPEPDLDAIRAIVGGHWTLYDLWEASPIRLGSDHSLAEEIMDGLFPGNPLLCCGKTQYTFATRRRETWRGRLAELPFMVPNPMWERVGFTQDGKQSEHTLENTAARVYLVVEFDFSEFARDGKTPTRWAPLVRDWRASDITVADACAALHLHLAARLPLVMAVHSGGKSLHGWYPAFSQTDSQLRQFMESAVTLGADPTTWTRSQFVRIPDGRRENSERQTAYYFDLGKAVKE